MVNITKEYINDHGQRHKSNGPAVVENNGRAWHWYLHGNEHRYYGPQCALNYFEWVDLWYIHGVLIE